MALNIDNHLSSYNPQSKHSLDLSYNLDAFNHVLDLSSRNQVLNNNTAGSKCAKSFTYNDTYNSAIENSSSPQSETLDDEPLDLRTHHKSEKSNSFEAKKNCAKNSMDNPIISTSPLDNRACSPTACNRDDIKLEGKTKFSDFHKFYREIVKKGFKIDANILDVPSAPVNSLTINSSHHLNILAADPCVMLQQNQALNLTQTPLPGGLYPNIPLTNNPMHPWMMPMLPQFPVNSSEKSIESKTMATLPQFEPYFVNNHYNHHSSLLNMQLASLAFQQQLMLQQNILTPFAYLNSGSSNSLNANIHRSSQYNQEIHMPDEPAINLSNPLKFDKPRIDHFNAERDNNSQVYDDMKQSYFENNGDYKIDSSNNYGTTAHLNVDEDGNSDCINWSSRGSADNGKERLNSQFETEDGRSTGTTLNKKSASVKDLLTTDSGVDLTYEEENCGAPSSGEPYESRILNKFQDAATKLGKEAIYEWKDKQSTDAIVSNNTNNKYHYHPYHPHQSTANNNKIFNFNVPAMTITSSRSSSTDPYDSKYIESQSLSPPSCSVSQMLDATVSPTYSSNSSAENGEMFEENEASNVGEGVVYEAENYSFLYPANEEEARAFKLHEPPRDERLAQLMRQQYQFYSLYGCGKEGQVQKGIAVKNVDELLMLKNQGGGRPCNKDERLALALSLPFSIEKIVTSPIDLFGQMLRLTDLTSEQVGLVRDIRRRGKNKIAAQNCRKRKLDLIMYLGHAVNNLKKSRSKLMENRKQLECEKAFYLKELNALFAETFSNNNLKSENLLTNETKSTRIQEYHLNTDSNGNGCFVSENLELPDLFFRWIPQNLV